MAGISYPTVPLTTPTGGVFNDSSSVYGSALLTFTSGGTQTYDTNDFTPEYEASRKELTNRNGVPIKAFGLPVTPNGNCNIIISSNSSQIPNPGWTFTADSTGTMTWIVEKVSTPFKKDDFLIVPLSYHQKLN
jgi:hypothetical protein